MLHRKGTTGKNGKRKLKKTIEQAKKLLYYVILSLKEKAFGLNSRKDTN